MSFKVLINGATGRMGQIAVATLSSDPDFQLVATPSRKDNLASSIQASEAQIVLDLTSAEVVYQNTCTIIEAGVYPVIGTTGLTQDQIASLQELCQEKKQGGLIAPNFSMGAALMMRFSAQAARYFEMAEIIEAHHENKKDAPSGTAMLTAERIASVRENASLPTATTEIIKSARGATVQSIPVHSIRLPGYAAYQNVIFGSKGETLQISHQAIHHDCYRAGILLACKKVVALQTLVYGLESVLD